RMAAGRYFSSFRNPLICSLSSGDSLCPWLVTACCTAAVSTSSSVPEMVNEQLFSLGYNRQSAIFRFEFAICWPHCLCGCLWRTGAARCGHGAWAHSCAWSAHSVRRHVHALAAVFSDDTGIALGRYVYIHMVSDFHLAVL